MLRRELLKGLGAASALALAANELQPGHAAPGGNAMSKPVDLFIYAANHAFVNDTRPDVYHPENTTVALERTFELFHSALK